MAPDMGILAHLTVHRLPHEPAHLYQYNEDPQAYKNEQGCGAFCTAMALSYYDLGRFGTYGAARLFFDEMLHVPFFGGTFESQNAAIARKYGFFSAPFDHGTVADLIAAIDSGAPTILLVNPGIFGIGRHDVLLVGYGTDQAGNCLGLFVNNPAIESPFLTVPPGLAYPGNEVYATFALQGKWTGCFTPIFNTAAAFDQWKQTVNRA
jgi:hypothetical protein